MCFNNERGFIYTWLALLMLPLTVLVLFMFVDAARFFTVRGQLAAMADAAALAAASTATLEYQYEYVPVYDGSGNLIRVEKRITKVEAVIRDPVLAEAVARLAALRNLGMIANQQGARMASISISPSAGSPDDFTGYPVGSDSYRVKLKCSVRPFVVGPLGALYGVSAGDKGVGAVATGQAVVSGP